MYLICFDTRFHGLKLVNTILSSERVSQCLSLITDGNLPIYWRCMVHILHTVYTVAWIHGSRMGREKERENYKEREGEIEREREGERDIYKERDERKEIETMGKEGERQGKEGWKRREREKERERGGRERGIYREITYSERDRGERVIGRGKRAGERHEEGREKRDIRIGRGEREREIDIEGRKRII